MIIGILLGGLLGSKVTSSHIQEFEANFVTTPQQKMVEYIKSTNKAVSETDAIQIVNSTMKWADEFNVDPYLIFAVQEVESTYDKYSMSKTGALGVMQVIPSWHLDKMREAIKDIGTPEIFNIHTNIYLGTWVLKSCMRQFNLTKNSLNCYNGSNAKPNGYDEKVLTAYRKIQNMMKG
jgi:soluble lytic murein transglycosylase-like protein